MTNWRDAILAHFVPHVSRLTIVADPDALLTEERLAVELRQKGFDLVEFTDSIEFRYACESQYRSVWDRGERTDLVVVLRLTDSSADSLPYDLLRAGRRLAFDLGSLFPHLSYRVLQSLDRGLLDEVFDAQTRAAPDRMGDNATKDFILRHVFGIAAELIATDTDLLRALLRLHYRSMRLPSALSDRLVKVLKVPGAFSGWPLEAIISDDATFYAFLQEGWPGFLRGHDGSGLHEEGAEYGGIYSGPDNLPFGHHDIRVYIDNLFVEGKLRPVHLPAGAPLPQSWMQSGIIN
ncbi:BREX-3 system phosphatase PglZ, partial [Mesorhizobium sp. P5_C1]